MSTGVSFENPAQPNNISNLFFQPDDSSNPQLFENFDNEPAYHVEDSILAKIILSVIICVFGIIGNALVIFVITILKEYKKSVTHWYVLQLSIADTLFLLTLPFKISQDLHDSWIYSEWMCKANETILFFNYYASCLFLVVMSMDRYVAVCKAFSTQWQKLRKPFSAFIIAMTIWAIAILLCIPVMLYSFKSGIEPRCKCSYEFPTEMKEGCAEFEHNENPQLYEECMKHFDKGKQKCFRPTTSAIEDIWGAFQTNSSAEDSFFLSDPALSDLQYLDFNSSALDNNFAATNLQPSAYQRFQCSYSNQSKYFIAFLLFNFIVMFLIPLGVMMMCYGLIVNRLSKSAVKSSTPNPTSFTKSINNGSQSHRKKSNSRSYRDRKRVTIMCAALVSTFVFCWLPFHAIHIAKIVGISNTEADTCKALLAVGTLFGFLNSALNPYLYSFLGTNFSRRWRTATRVLQQTVNRKRTSSSSSVFGSSGAKSKRFRNSATSGFKTTATQLARENIDLKLSTLDDTNCDEATTSITHCHESIVASGCSPNKNNSFDYDKSEARIAENCTEGFFLPSTKY